MLDSLSRVCLTLCLLLPALAQQNVVLSSTDPDIIYNPPLCSSSSSVAGCTSPWQVSNDTIPGSVVVYTNGPIPQAGNVLPQIGNQPSTLYLRTTPSSNATVNLTLTAEPTDVSITSELNTSISLIVAVNIPETQTTTLGVTFLQGDLPTRFDIESITLTVANASATSSFLPSPSLPVSSSPPTVVSSPTVSSTPSTGASSNEGTIIGAVLGGVLGALSLVIAFLVIYRYRKRQTTNEFGGGT
ncbi:hypothetical protein J3R83DRAFT_8625 [Lanmaoa asiatica]|nr:hypothetical protein J3R83DRAFT_8625 [Lanmaoa asiatica]